MPRNVSEQEIDALLGEPAEPRPPVVPRDFREPRRFAASDLEALERAGQAAAAGVVDALRAQACAAARLEGFAISESSLESALRDRAARLVGAIADGPAGPSVATLDLAGAVQIAEAALGVDEGEPAAARDLSPVERKVLERVMQRALESALQPFQVSAKDARFAADRTALARELAAVSDGRRIALSVEIGLGAAKTVLHVHLAGIKAPASKSPGASKDARKSALPPQLAPTHVELRAVLSQLEILLTDLLAIEPGDVIPLTLSPGDPIEVQVEGEARARARFGEHQGKLALRITEVQRPPAQR